MDGIIIILLYPGNAMHIFIHHTSLMLIQLAMIDPVMLLKPIVRDAIKWYSTYYIVYCLVMHCNNYLYCHVAIFGGVLIL